MEYFTRNGDQKRFSYCHATRLALFPQPQLRPLDLRNQVTEPHRRWSRKFRAPVPFYTILTILVPVEMVFYKMALVVVTLALTAHT